MGLTTLRTTGAFLVLVFVLQSLTDCAASPLTRNESVISRRHRGRIVGGTDARQGEFPWQVSLQLPQFGVSEQICGGVIINTRTILTAGHCFTDQDTGRAIEPSSIIIVAGLTNIDNPEGPGQTVEVADAEVHRDFNPETLENDIAIVTLATPLTFTVRVSSIPIAGIGSVPSGVCTVVGWGDTEEPFAPEVLQKVDLVPMDRSNCRNLWTSEEPSAKITNGMVCAHHPYKGTCHGDSGSGFICKNSAGAHYLAGLVSWGQSVPECAYDGELPSVFTNIAHYVDWIGPH